MNYKVVDIEKYYRKSIYKHFTEDAKCSISITSRIDVTNLKNFSKIIKRKFYINFLYVLSKALNSREDYKMVYHWKTNKLVIYDKINPKQYIFHDDTETITVIYTEYDENYEIFYKNAFDDLNKAKATRDYGLDTENHPNWFDASYIPFISYDSLNIELPDGYLYFNPIINWGSYQEENGKFLMPVTVRLNHAIADGYHVARVYKLIEEEITNFLNMKGLVK